MPFKRSNSAVWWFVILFVYIIYGQLTVVQPVLNVYYFMISTTLISLKLAFAFYYSVKSKPCYVERASGEEFEFKNLLKTVPSQYLCADCKVIRPPRSHHCQVCNRCTDRYETHCTWMNNCVGRGNSNHHMILVFYVWLDVFLLGWISMSTVRVTECAPYGHPEDHYQTPCYYRALCLGCNNLYWHYLVTISDMLICFFFMAFTTWPMIRTWINYCKGETSYERFYRTAKVKDGEFAGNEKFEKFTTTQRQAIDSKQV